MTSPKSPPWADLLANPGLDGHIVQLYQDDDFLGEAVSCFAAEGFVRRESVIIVATAAHWDVLANRLHQRGFDIAELARRGQLTLLDADQTLPKFLVNDMPDAGSFKGIAGSTIKNARAGGLYPKVRWWGEMVNVLYVEGNGRASTRLEELFDEVAHEHTVAIFCSFLMDKFGRDAYDGPMQDVCRTHAHLIPTDDYDRHRECVDRAVAEVFQGTDGPFLRLVVGSTKWSGPEMPSSQALLLWLKETRPDLADKVLDAARRYDRRDGRKNTNGSH